MNFTACDLTICSGNGYCTGDVHRCICLGGYIPPRCLWYMGSDEAQSMYNDWQWITTFIIGMIIIIAIWRVTVLTMVKYRAMRQHHGIHVLTCTMKLSLVMDSQLICIIMTLIGFILYFTSIRLGLPNGEVMQYCLDGGTISMLVGVTYYIRVFAIIVGRYSGTSLRLVNWLDRVCMIYVIITLITIIVRPFTNVQTSSPAYSIMVICHIIYIVLLIGGSGVFASTVVRHALTTATASVAPLTDPTYHYANDMDAVHHTHHTGNHSTGGSSSLPAASVGLVMGTTSNGYNGNGNGHTGSVNLTPRTHYRPNNYMVEEPPSAYAMTSDNNMTTTTTTIGDCTFNATTPNHNNNNSGLGPSRTPTHGHTSILNLATGHSQLGGATNGGAPMMISGAMMVSPNAAIMAAEIAARTVATPKSPYILAAEAIAHQRAESLRSVMRTIRSLEIVGVMSVLCLGISFVMLKGTSLATIMGNLVIGYYIPIIGGSLLLYVMARTPHIMYDSTVDSSV